MKKYIFLSAFALLLVVLFFSNPSEAVHTATVKEILTKALNKNLAETLNEGKNGNQTLGAGLGLMFGATMIDKAVDAFVERDNFYVFSLTKVKYEGKERYIGLGILGNVYISDQVKDHVGEFLENTGKK